MQLISLLGKYADPTTLSPAQAAVVTDEINSEIRKLTLYFLGLGAATLVASFLEVAMFMWSGTRQVARLRQRYLEASLKQEQAYYDTQATSGDVLGGLNEDCQAVQNAISEKVGNAIHNVGALLCICKLRHFHPSAGRAVLHTHRPRVAYTSAPCCV